MSRIITFVPVQVTNVRDLLGFTSLLGSILPWTHMSQSTCIPAERRGRYLSANLTYVLFLSFSFDDPDAVLKRSPGATLNSLSLDLASD